MFSCVNQIVAGALRGAGDSKGPMFIMLASFVLFRQLYLFVVSNFISNAPIAVCMGYPFGWFVCCIITLIYFKRFKFEKCKIVEEARKKELENGNSDN